MRNLRFVFAIMLVVALSAPALAEIRPGAFSVSPFVGGSWFEGNQDLKHRPAHPGLWQCLQQPGIHPGPDLLLRRPQTGPCFTL